MWYLSMALKPIGPFSLSEIREKIKQGQLGPKDLVFNQDSQEWRQAIEWQDIRHLGFPAFESLGTSKDAEPVWVVLHINEESKTYQQEGPYATKDIKWSLKSGRLGFEDLIWKEGLSGWSRLGDRCEFTSPDL